MKRVGLYPPSVQPGVPKLGVRPHGWQIVRLGDVFEEVTRPIRLDPSATYQLVTAKRSRGGIVAREVRRGVDIKTKSQFRTEAGDFLISRRQIVHGACGLVPDELSGAVVSNEYSTLRLRPGFDPKFLSYFAHTRFFQQTCFHSSIGVHVEKMVFKLDRWFRWKACLPPLREQVRIAEILGAWDDAIERVNALIQAKQKLKRALMQQLLTPKRRFPQFNGQWRCTRLGDLGAFSKGAGVSKADVQPTGYPAIRYGELYTTHDIVVRHVTTFIDDDAKNSSKAIARGDILFAGSGETAEEIGSPAVYLDKETAYAGGDIIVFSPKDGDPLFLAYALNAVHARKYLAAQAQGKSIVHIHIPSLRGLPLSIPAVDEQKEIAACLEAAQKECDCLERLARRLEVQRRGLMQKLLTGQVRVKPHETGDLAWSRQSS